MMPILVWGAPDLPDISGDHQGVDLMKVRNVRLMSAVIAAMTVLTIAALSVPAAMGASQNSFVFVTQPVDAKAGATITSAHFVDGTSFVQVKLVDGSSDLVTNSKAVVTFTLEGPDVTSSTLYVEPQPLVDGVATFGEGTLSVATENEPQFTDYRLVPISTKNPLITGDASDPFDIWEAGDSCTGVPPSEGEDPDICVAELRGGNDEYKLEFTEGSLGASELFGALPGLTCPGQDLIFDDRIFSYATTETDNVPDHPVFLSNHITKEEWQASANNGQAHADWCIGLPTNAPWEANGAESQGIDFNGPDVDGGVLFVALAPRCPVANPQGSAPCIVSRTGDGAGGSITVGWLPGGDPPRRT
jgi:hypothetical protein